MSKTKQAIINGKITTIFDYLDKEYFKADIGNIRHAYITNGNYYEWYHTLSKHYKPTSYLEIGVRYGYSMLSVASASLDTLKKIHGLDSECYIEDSNQKAKANLKRLLGKDSGIEVTIEHCDTQEIEELPGSFDMVHVDGAHGTEGVKHDLKMTLGKAKIVLADDYHTMARTGIDQFVEENIDSIAEWYDLDTERGMCVIEYAN